MTTRLGTLRFLAELLTWAWIALSAGCVAAQASNSDPVATSFHCRPEQPPSSTILASVTDGDTLVLGDDRRVRLIGINAPERSHIGDGGEPGALRATVFAREFLGAGTLGIVPGVADKDRHGRLLAHVYAADGNSLEEALLEAGLARQIVIPPNIAMARCLMQAEQRARVGLRGLWGSGEFQPRETMGLVPGENGFRLLHGRAASIEKTRSSWWIALDDRVALRIDRADREHFTREQLDAIENHAVEARGWLIWRDSGKNRKRGHPPWMMRIRHPQGLQPLDR